MARINIDDFLDRDPRVMALRDAIGQIATLGSLVAAYQVAEHYYVPERKPIPAKLFNLLPWGKPLLETGVAELNDDQSGVFIIFSEEQFRWLLAKYENGKKGGRPKASGEEPRPTEPEPATTEEEPNITESKPKITEANLNEPNLSYGNPLTLTPAPAPVKKVNTKKLKAVDPPEHAVAPSAPASDLALPKRSKFSDTTRAKMRAFISAYAEAYKTKYEHLPEQIRGDKGLIGKIGHWIEHVPEVRAVSLVQVYLQVSYKPFDDNYHDLWQFFRHLNRIGIALETGKDANTTDWSKVFARVG